MLGRKKTKKSVHSAYNSVDGLCFLLFLGSIILLYRSSRQMLRSRWQQWWERRTGFSPSRFLFWCCGAPAFLSPPTHRHGDGGDDGDDESILLKLWILFLVLKSCKFEFKNGSRAARQSCCSWILPAFGHWCACTPRWVVHSYWKDS